MFKAQCVCKGCGTEVEVDVGRYHSLIQPKDWSCFSVDIAHNCITSKAEYHFCPECSEKYGFNTGYNARHDESAADRLVDAIIEIAQEAGAEAGAEAARSS